MRTAIYPGSFDPFTNGHLDVVQRAARFFDRVIVAVAMDDGKQPLVHVGGASGPWWNNPLGKSPNVEADAFDGLLVDYVGAGAAQAVLRGLRAVSDFEFEFQLALMNRKLNERVRDHLHDAQGHLHLPQFAHRQGNCPARRRCQRVRARARAGGPDRQVRLPPPPGSSHAAARQSPSPGEATTSPSSGELPVADLDLDTRDEMIRVQQPLRYDLEVQQLDDSLLVRGKLLDRWTASASAV